MLQLLAQLLNQHVSAEGLGSLDGEAERTRPDQLSEDAESARHAEHHGVVVHLLKSVILQGKNYMYKFIALNTLILLFCNQRNKKIPVGGLQSESPHWATGS